MVKITPSLLALCLGFITTALNAQVKTTVYNLENVFLLPHDTHPYDPAEPMSGTFEWTYTLGDFENGTGTFLSLDLPWYGSDFSGLNINVDLDSIEFTLPGNWHSAGVDLTLKLITPLSTSIPSVVDTTTSKFEIWAGPPYQGSVISGEVVPVTPLHMVVLGTCPNLQIDISGASPSAKLAVLYAFNTGSFLVPNGYLCAGTMLGLDSTAALGKVLTSDAFGGASTGLHLPPGLCGQLYVQALDLTSCGISEVMLLE